MKEYYEDNEEELASKCFNIFSRNMMRIRVELILISVPPIDPLSPKSEGGISVPSCGEQLVVSTQWPKTFLAALQQHAIQQPRANAITIVDEQTKSAQTLTFRKLIDSFERKMTNKLINERTGKKAERRA
jgi:hypothetical protein